MYKRRIYILALLMAATACLWASAWACEAAPESIGESLSSAAMDSAVKAGAASDTQTNQVSRARTVNGMQVIELEPSQGTTIYATVGPDGKITVSHSPEVDTSQPDD